MMMRLRAKDCCNTVERDNPSSWINAAALTDSAR